MPRLARASMRPMAQAEIIEKEVAMGMISQIDALRQMHPEWPVAEFLAAADPGDLSPVLPVYSGGAAEFMLLYRFESRSEATEALPFGGLELQRSLRDTISEETQTFRVDRGVSELARTSRVAPNELRMRLIRGPARR